MAPVAELLSGLASRLSSPSNPQGQESSLEARTTPQSSKYNPGGGVVAPTTINNNAVFALFGILGAGLVLTSIWFFFWAKNGGFRFRKGDWEEYKSTVLRRKGPNGTTLSGATKTTELGGGSIVGSQGSMSDMADAEKGEAHGAGPKKAKKTRPNRHDVDVRAYRAEKVARVGGLNREPDGSYHDYSTTEGSMLAGASAQRKPGGNRETVRPVRASNNPPPPMRQNSFAAGTEASFSTGDSHRPLNRVRPNNNRHSQPAPAAKRTTGPPRSNQRYSERASMPGSFTEPLDFDSRYEPSDAGQAQNTKAYFHPIPGLSSANGNNAGPARGFRRGGGGRRDSLSDSEVPGSYRS